MNPNCSPNLHLPMPISEISPRVKTVQMAFAGRNMPTHQPGFVLFTAIMFLIMLSLLAVNAAQMSILEEKMAGNGHSHDLAYQSAEMALTYAQAAVLPCASNAITVPTTAAQSSGVHTMPSTGLYQANLCYPNTNKYWNSNSSDSDYDCANTAQKFTWSSSTALPVSTNTSGPPWFIVERLPDSGVPTNPPAASTGVPSAGSACPATVNNCTTGTQQYRVTSYGVNGDNSSVVILQAMYAC